MKFPRVTYAAETLLNTYGTYHLARLAADPSLGDLLRDFSEAQDRLRERVDAHAAARTASMTAMAARQKASAALGTAIRAFSLALQAKVGNPRTSSLYRLYFPKGHSPVVEAGPQAKLHSAGMILTLLPREEDEALRALAAPLAAARDSLETALRGHEAAQGETGQLHGGVQAEKFRWLDAYARNYRDLRVRYFREPAKAETLFRSAPRGGIVIKERLQR